MLFCSIKGANRGYIQVLLATSRNRIYFRRRSNDPRRTALRSSFRSFRAGFLSNI
ncbi:hypothetical protein [Cardinium endosymbiont of Tipula unca]|uniref:hypothetical protein n=1 Tax=Cardinium endosymbiont of Tipula unca TaxID=3066216 RepID=UPI0030D10418